MTVHVLTPTSTSAHYFFRSYLSLSRALSLSLSLSRARALSRSVFSLEPARPCRCQTCLQHIQMVNMCSAVQCPTTHVITADADVSRWLCTSASAVAEPFSMSAIPSCSTVACLTLVTKHTETDTRTQAHTHTHTQTSRTDTHTLRTGARHEAQHKSCLRGGTLTHPYNSAVCTFCVFN